jgi:hypothetical protein
MAKFKTSERNIMNNENFMYIFLHQLHTGHNITKIIKCLTEIRNIEILIYTHLYKFSTGLNKIRQKEVNVLRNVMNTRNIIYSHLKKFVNKVSKMVLS